MMHQAAEVMIQSFTIQIRMAIVHLAALPEADIAGSRGNCGLSPGHRDRMIRRARGPRVKDAS